LEAQSVNREQALKHMVIAALARYHTAMHNLKMSFIRGHISRELMDSTLTAEVKSEARDSCIRAFINKRRQAICVPSFFVGVED
jgi:hypothetical protein